MFSLLFVSPVATLPMHANTAQSRDVHQTEASFWKKFLARIIFSSKVFGNSGTESNGMDFFKKKNSFTTQNTFLYVQTGFFVTSSHELFATSRDFGKAFCTE